MRLEALLARAGMILLMLGCGSGTESSTEPEPDRPDIVLITFDTLRADFLGAYGDENTRTPTLDRFARNAVTFDRAYAASPFTPTSLWSLLHSVWIHDHTYETNLRARYKGARSFVERLDESGYDTAGFTGSSILNRGSGFGKGFDHYEDTWSTPYLHNETTLSRVNEYLDGDFHDERDDSPFFLYVHFYDPHGLWGDAPSEFADYGGERSEFAALKASQFEKRNARKRSSVRMIQSILKYLDSANLSSRRPKDLAELIVPSYRSEVTWSDDILHRLMEKLDERDVLSESMIIVSSDHGYTFADHYQVSGYVFPLFDETIRVPLFVRPPGEVNGDVSTPVSLVDIGATILDYAGIADEHGAGRSLRGLIEGDQENARRRVVYAEGVAIRENQMEMGMFRGDDRGRYAPGVENRHTMLFRPPYKLIHMPHRRGEHFELFDLEGDPKERRNLFSPSNPEHAQLVEMLLAHERALESNEGKEGAIDDEALQRLRALGYIREKEGGRSGGER